MYTYTHTSYMYCFFHKIFPDIFVVFSTVPSADVWTPLCLRGSLWGPCWQIIWQPLSGSHFPSPLENATSDREGGSHSVAGKREHRRQDAGSREPAAGLVQVPVLEGGDGADAGRPPVLGENNICKRDRCKSSAAVSHLARAGLTPVSLISGG